MLKDLYEEALQLLQSIEEDVNKFCFKNNKIDVSDQIKLNENQFLTYLWNWFTERELKKNG